MKAFPQEDKGSCRNKLSKIVESSASEGERRSMSNHAALLDPAVVNRLWRQVSPT